MHLLKENSGPLRKHGRVFETRLPNFIYLFIFRPNVFSSYAANDSLGMFSKQNICSYEILQIFGYPHLILNCTTPQEERYERFGISKYLYSYDSKEEMSIGTVWKID